MTLHRNNDVQELCKRLVEPHVYTCLSGLFYALAQGVTSETFSGYAIHDFYRTHDADNPEDATPCEVYEQWHVSSWLAHQLKREGETVREFFGMFVWLRTCTGQAVFLDTCFRNILQRVRGVLP